MCTNNFIKSIPLFLQMMLFVSCSKDSTITGANSTQSKITLKDTLELLKYPFENNNTFSIQGWRITSPYSSSSDVPSDGGSYSVLFKPDSFSSNTASYTLIPPLSTYTRRFLLSFDLKITNPDSLVAITSIMFYTPHGFRYGGGTGIDRADHWLSLVGISDTVTSKIDSLVLQFFYSNNKMSTRYLYDNVRLIQQEYY